MDFPFGRRWIVDGSIVHTNFTGPAALDHYNTFGGEVVYRALGKSENERNSSRYFRVGIYSDQGSNYHSAQLQVGTAWKFQFRRSAFSHDHSETLNSGGNTRKFYAVP